MFSNLWVGWWALSCLLGEVYEGYYCKQEAAMMGEIRDNVVQLCLRLRRARIPIAFKTRSHAFIGRRRMEAEGKGMLRQGQARRVQANIPTWTEAVCSISIFFVNFVRRSDVPCLWWRSLSLVAFVELRRRRCIGHGPLSATYIHPENNTFPIRDSHRIRSASQGGSFVGPRDV